MKIKTILVVFVLLLSILAASCSQASAKVGSEAAVTVSGGQLNSPETLLSPAPLTSPVPSAPSAGAVEESPTSKPAVTSAVSSPKVVTVNDILSSPKNFQDQSVIVKGKIVTECGSGCWFNLKDSTGTIYVDLAPSNLVIPPKVGATATVSGKVTFKGNDVYLIGTKVEF
jgi:uncharacterized protein YdeI (BOF family)